MRKTALKYQEVARRSDNTAAETNISIELNEADLTLDDVVNRLVRPMLHAIGFSGSVIDEYLGEY